MDMNNIDMLRKKAEEEISAINFAEIKVENEREESVCSDLNLWDGRNTVIGYADVSWTSSDEEAVSVSGSVTCGKEPKEVEITAHFSYQDYPEIAIDKTFKITVLAGSGEKPKANTIEVERGNSQPALFVIGDSTASPFPHTGENNRYPQTGWAQCLHHYFDPEKLSVVDLALSGRSSKSFKNDTNYKIFNDEIQKGDYLILQFGHNDSKSEDPNRYTFVDGGIADEGSYKNSMSVYIETAKQRGANPIIATSISRMKLSDESLERYVNAAKELAAELNIPVIDMYKRTNDWVNEVGLEAAKDLYKYIRPHDYRFMDDPEYLRSQYYESALEEGETDGTHLNIYGADLVAQWAAEELSEKAPELKEYMTGYKAKYPLPSYNHK